MEKNYVAPPGAYRKLKLARGLRQNVYMYAATGYGKTTLLRQYLGFQKNQYYDCRSQDDLDRLFSEEPGGKRDYLIIDNLHFLADEEKKQEIVKLAGREDLWLILIGRARLPEWLKQLYYAEKLMLIKEEDFYLGEKEIQKIAMQCGFSLKGELLSCICKRSEGNAYVITVLMRSLREGEELGEELFDRIEREFQGYLESQIISSWDAEVQEFLMKVSVVDSFDEDLARFITGDDRAARMLEQAMDTGNFMFCEKGSYHFRPVLLEALRRRGEKKLGLYLMNQCRYNAGRYYEQKEEIEAALSMYEQLEGTENIRSLLVKNGRRNPGAGYYYELRRYYLALSEKEIESDVILMSAMSMLYSILMKEEESEYWYRKLKAYSRTLRGGEKREAESRLCYLDIALPHRGNVGILEIIKNSPKLLFSRGISLPEMSVTNNQPSVMNGGKDFCEWTRKDKLLADTIGVLLEKVLRSFGHGLVNVGLGESFYEKGMDNYLVLKHLTRAQVESQEGGKLEIGFVSVGLQIRLSMLVGDERNAFRLMESFEKTVQMAGEKQFLPNIGALRCRMALYVGDRETVDAWMEQAPDEDKDFCTLERYRYLTKLRVLILRGNYLQAFSLIEKLRYYAEKSKRTYIQMQLGLFEAVIRYLRKGEWYEDFMKTLSGIAEFQFIRIVSEEGGLILPLLKQVKKSEGWEKVLPKDWFMQVYKEASYMADHYPSYNHMEIAAPIDFKPEELKVLRLQAEGKTIKEMAEFFRVNERTIKYWSSENYKKLKVKGKIEAVQKAKQLGLI